VRTAASPLPVVPAATARRLLLQAQGLLADPARRATPAAVYRQIERMGFVQVDSINVVERAHHHILLSRFDHYRPAMLEKLLERDRKLFEHWTHDAAVIPVPWLRYWLPRFDRFRERWSSRWARRLGPEPEKMIAHVRGRIAREGPLMSKDFEHDGGPRPGSWWSWKPQKMALEYLWRTGELSVAKRVNFQKVYDLMERTFPHLDFADRPTREELVDWACREALARLVVATPAELARLFEAVDVKAAQSWCEQARLSGDVAEVVVEPLNGEKPRRAYALPDWRSRARRAQDAPDRIRLLSPFEPVLRDRSRTLQLFGFDYRLEAFVPAAQRRFGYYVLPILEGDRLVGRIDPKLQREHGALEIRGLWWEPGVRPTRARTRRLRSALDLFSQQLGADDWRPTSRRVTAALGPGR
jgi:uncharacterized protein YcaQ